MPDRRHAPRGSSTVSVCVLLTIVVPQPALSQPAQPPRRVPQADSAVAGASNPRLALPLPTARERRRAYLADVLGPGATIRAAALAGVDQWQDTPRAWRQGVDGYGRRVASRAGGIAAQITLEHGLAAAARQDLRYAPHRTGSTGHRLWHAVSSAALARRADGHSTLSVGTLAGAYGGRLAETSWQPGGVSHAEAATAVLFTLGARGLVNVVREFQP